MGGSEIDEKPEDFPPDDPTWVLERLETELENLGPPEEPTPGGSPLSWQEVDELVDQVLSEELKRLHGAAAKGKE